MHNKKVLNLVQAWLPSFSAMYHYTKFGIASVIADIFYGIFLVIRISNSLATSSSLAVPSLVKLAVKGYKSPSFNSFLSFVLPTFRSFGQRFSEYYLLHLLLVLPFWKQHRVIQKWNRVSQTCSLYVSIVRQTGHIDPAKHVSRAYIRCFASGV
jgi:hypothetical protein